MSKPPAHPKIYHILHVDRLPSIIEDGHLWCDAVIMGRENTGTAIGMGGIKERRLRLALDCCPGLHVGQCVPFYFCPRSVMLYMIYCANNEELEYHGGQGSIIHLEADLHATVQWAGENGKRWAFTLSNAGSSYFEDRCNIDQLDEINWDAVRAEQWSGPGISTLIKDGKQAEFLVEEQFPWELVERVGVYSQAIAHQTLRSVQEATHQPKVEIKAEWYY